jgi:predicted Zn-ribbon and HTH transcriptional regulator
METALVGTEDRECPICLEKLPMVASGSQKEGSEGNQVMLDIAQLEKCGHTFHQSCLDTHEELRQNGTCPMCRTPLWSTDAGCGTIWARTTNLGGERRTINLLDYLEVGRFLRDNPDIALQEATAHANTSDNGS